MKVNILDCLSDNSCIGARVILDKGKTKSFLQKNYSMIVLEQEMNYIIQN